MEVIRHPKHATIFTAERLASVIGGSALVAAGLMRRSGSGVMCALAGAELLRRGIMGHSVLYESLGIRTASKGQGGDTTSVPYELGVRVDHAITVNKPRAEVYAFWRRLENLPRFMSTSSPCSSWTRAGRAGRQQGRPGAEWNGKRRSLMRSKTN